MAGKKDILYSGKQLKPFVENLSQAILRDPDARQELALIGIARGGVPLAKRLREELIAQGHPEPLFGILDITFYRDDIALRARHPVIRRTDIPFSLDHKYVVLVDDVFFSGRTTRAALDAIVDFGRPLVVRLAVLVNRGFRELPIQPDFVGTTLDTQKSDRVEVHWQELGDEEDSICIIKNWKGETSC